MRIVPALLIMVPLVVGGAAPTGWASPADRPAAEPVWEVDAAYGGDGLVQIDDTDGTGFVVLPKGAAYTIAEPDAGSDEVFLVRVTARGDLDPDFGEDGLVRLPFRAPAAHLTLALQQTPEGRRLVVAQWTSTGGITPFYRLRLDGRFDRSFGDGGVAAMRLGRDVVVRGLHASPDSVLAVGECPIGDVGVHYDPCIVALTADGSPDTEFGPDGFRVWRAGGRDTAAYAVTTDPDGSRVYVGGWAERGVSWVVGAFRPDGRPDRDFGADGVARLDATCGPARYGVTQLHVQSSGQLLVSGGTCANSAAVARLTADGVLDEGFGDGGWVELSGGGHFVATDLDPATEVLHWMLGGDDGDLHVGGVRPDGTADPAFGPSGELVIDLAPDARGFWDRGLAHDRKGRLYAKAWYPDDVAFDGVVIARAVKAETVPAS